MYTDAVFSLVSRTLFFPLQILPCQTLIEPTVAAKISLAPKLLREGTQKSEMRSRFKLLIQVLVVRPVSNTQSVGSPQPILQQ